MPAPQDRLARLRRPRLLIRAARFGLGDYRRTRTVRRLLTAAQAHTPEAVVTVLLDHEARAEASRRAGEAGYSIAHHVEMLIAVMAESRHLPPRRSPPIAPPRAAQNGQPPAPAPKPLPPERPGSRLPG